MVDAAGRRDVAAFAAQSLHLEICRCMAHVPDYMDLQLKMFRDTKVVQSQRDSVELLRSLTSLQV